MTKDDVLKYLDNLILEIGKPEHQDLQNYLKVLDEAKHIIKSTPDNNVQCKNCIYSKRYNGAYYCRLDNSEINPLDNCVSGIAN